MSLAACIPVADMAAANSTLETQGYGPSNFSVPVFATSAGPTYATLHAWGPQAFIDAVKAIPGVIWSETGERPRDKVEAALSTFSGKWKPQLLEGWVEAGNLYEDADGGLWWAIQGYNSADWPDPSVIPSLIRRARIPGVIAPWQQPLDQFDAYKLVNQFTGEPDHVTHNGQTWKVVQADGAGNNTYPPGVWGWEQVQ